jgi:hypothetical protein
MNLLSVDWDFFFPCADWYDWGHSENKALFLEWIWQVRSGNVHLQTGKLALDHFVPRERELSTFWNTVCPKTNLLIIADSHSDIQIILQMGGWKVWNFDAHHDIRYGKREKNPKYRCDNWVDVGRRKKKIDEYNLIYPKWRKKDKETIPEKFPVNVFYGIPDDLPEFNAVFICRSSAWIPTWWDARWIKFIEYWKKKDRMLWDNKVSCEFALKVRSPNMEEARELAVEQIKQREQMKELLLKNGKTLL